MFYNTGISTYIWVLSNRKQKRRKGKIQLVNGVDFFQKMRKSLGVRVDRRKARSVGWEQGACENAWFRWLSRRDAKPT
jgi:hypothetical protein